MIRNTERKSIVNISFHSITPNFLILLKVKTMQHDACGDMNCECNREHYDKYIFRNTRRSNLISSAYLTGLKGAAEIQSVGPSVTVLPLAEPTTADKEYSTCINIRRVTDIALPPDAAVAYDEIIEKHGNIEYSVGGASVYIWEPGYYQIYYSVNPQQAAQFAVKLNDKVIQGSVVSGGAIAGSIIVLISAKDLTQPTHFHIPFAALIQIVNCSTMAPIILNSSPVRASLTINLIKVFNDS